MNEQLPIYNSRTIKTYIEYLRTHYPQIDVDLLLEYGEMSREEVEDPAHWFTQHQIDRFHEILAAETDNPNVSREAGRYAAISKGSGALKHYAMGFMSPSTAYRLLEKITPHLTRGGAFKTVKLGPNKMEVHHILHPGIRENRYQCENRMGQLEAIAKIFTNRFAQIEHPTCFHRGGELCRYVITWDKTPHLRWQRLRNWVAVFGGLMALGLFFFLSLLPWFTAVLGLLAFTLACALQSDRMEKKQMTKSIAFQSDTAGIYLEEMQVRYNDALLIQEIGQMSSAIQDVPELARQIIRAVEMRLGFEQGMIMLLEEKRARLLYVAGYGFSEREETPLRESGLHLGETGHPFVNALKGDKPVLHRHGEGGALEAVPSSIQTGMVSFVCVPLVCEGVRLGILAVGNKSTFRTITQSDVNLIKGIGSGIGLSISKALAFQKLQESEHKYRELVENAASIILRRDVSGKIVFLNEFAERFFGYTKDELLGTDMLGSIVPERDESGTDQATVMKNIDAEPEKNPSLELEVKRRDGKRALVAWTHRALRDEEGRIREILCVGNDITGLKQAEEKRQVLEARLQRAQKMEALGTLAGGVAHDLNNILPSLISYPELMLMELPEESPLRKPLLGIKHSGEKAAALAQDLLTLARRGVPATTPVDINRVVLEYLESPEFGKIEAEQPGLKVETNLDETLAKVVGSPVQLYKVVMNLVVNAAEAMPQGGKISIATECRQVTGRTRAFEVIEPGDYAVLMVSDTGIGIGAHDMEKIFEPFFSKKKLGRSGSGLGMAVVWGAVKDHKGFIDVQSALGKGTVFTIFLPTMKS
jgi:PAS domain S-box-containing protein